MRRRTPGAIFVAEEQKKLLAALPSHSAPRISAALEELVRPERREKLRRAIDARPSAAGEHSVRIPMRGFAESLNVSVTAAILLEHATGGRPGDLPPQERELLYARALVLTVPHAAEFLLARGILAEPLPPAALALA